ncbi:Ig-like domain-containing protein, partial [Parabacteroides distasonis]|uniref:Ig-like domain-containing protein n=1 Tax=Parabacteroides distasonis TaxID=823 RepID=UPI00325A5921
TCEITVKPVPVESITFDTYSYNVEIGGQRQLSVTILPEGARDTKIKWSSSNTTVAPIDENGLVRGNTSGSTVITATTEDGHTATCNVYAVDIDQMMEIYFPSSSLAIINGFYTGSITCAIKNNTFKTVAETSDKSLLGNELKPGQTIALSGRFNSVYEPGFFWEMEYNGRTFKTYQKYGNKSSRSIKIEDTGKAKELISLTRIQ